MPTITYDSRDSCVIWLVCYAGISPSPPPRSQWNYWVPQRERTSKTPALVYLYSVHIILVISTCLPIQASLTYTWDPLHVVHCTYRSCDNSTVGHAQWAGWPQVAPSLMTKGSRTEQGSLRLVANFMHMFCYVCMYQQLRSEVERQGNANKSTTLWTSLSFQEELPQVGFEPTTLCSLYVCICTMQIVCKCNLV